MERTRIKLNEHITVELQHLPGANSHLVWMINPFTFVGFVTPVTGGFKIPGEKKIHVSLKTAIAYLLLNTIILNTPPDEIKNILHR